MEPSLEPGDRLLAVRVRRPVRRGDILVFRHPDRPDLWLVKRVVGLPAETVEIRDGAVTVDGAALAEPWAHGETHPGGRWNVPPASAFVLSDARSRTRADGRTLGPVLLDGAYRAVFRYAPARRLGRPHRVGDRSR